MMFSTVRGGPIDVEVFHASGADMERQEMGFYFAFGTYGCLWDSEPEGPFETEAEALRAARNAAGCCEHGVMEDDDCYDCPLAPLWVAVSPTGTDWISFWKEHSFALNLRDGIHRTSDVRCAAAWWTPEHAAQFIDHHGLAGFTVVRLTDDENRVWGHLDREIKAS